MSFLNFILNKKRLLKNMSVSSFIVAIIVAQGLVKDIEPTFSFTLLGISFILFSLRIVSLKTNNNQND